MKEKKQSKKFLESSDFVINITGGTKAMVAAASTAAFLAGSRLYYVLDSKRVKGKDLVLELPLPSIPRDDNRGSTTKTSSIVLELIGELRKTNNSRLLGKLEGDKRIGKLSPQKLQYHLNKLEVNKLITINRGWVTGKKNQYTGQYVIDKKKTPIEITNTGKYYADFPDLVGNIL